MSPDKRPPLEGFYIYIFLLFAAFMIADLARLKTQLVLEKQKSLKPDSPQKFESFGRSLYTRGLTYRDSIPFKNYKRIIDRNLFNSDGLIPSLKGTIEEEILFDENERPVKTGLPIEVIGTIVHANPYRSIASILLQGSKIPEALKIGRRFEDLIEVLAVFRKRLVFRNLKNQKLEFAEIPEDPILSQKKEDPPPEGFKPLKKPKISRQGNKFSLNRQEVISQLKDYKSLLQTARAIPYKDPITGEPIGFKVIRLLPGSLFEELGIQRGDVIKNVNGEPVNSINKALEVFANIKSSVNNLNNVNLIVERNGSEKKFNYTVE